MRRPNRRGRDAEQGAGPPRGRPLARRGERDRQEPLHPHAERVGVEAGEEERHHPRRRRAQACERAVARHRRPGSRDREAEPLTAVVGHDPAIHRVLEGVVELGDPRREHDAARVVGRGREKPLERRAPARKQAVGVPNPRRGAEGLGLEVRSRRRLVDQGLERHLVDGLVVGRQRRAATERAALELDLDLEGVDRLPARRREQVVAVLEARRAEQVDRGTDPAHLPRCAPVVDEARVDRHPPRPRRAVAQERGLALGLEADHPVEVGLVGEGEGVAAGAALLVGGVRVRGEPDRGPALEPQVDLPGGQPARAARSRRHPKVRALLEVLDDPPRVLGQEREPRSERARQVRPRREGSDTVAKLLELAEQHLPGHRGVRERRERRRDAVTTARRARDRPHQPAASSACRRGGAARASSSGRRRGAGAPRSRRSRASRRTAGPRAAGRCRSRGRRPRALRR